ncbi:MAG: cytochrome c oxidase assembly protein [Candidatus Promineifilaceae bacterium]|nr:cytochrome c oxidase assembly protein [Anaerolineaceae bacterium]
MSIWDFGIGSVLVTAVLLYLRGWRRQPAEDRRTLLASPWRMITFAAALLLLAAVLFSPLHGLATRYFYIHVLQRLLLVSLIPCLFMSGNPLPILQAGLPTKAQNWLWQLPQTAPRFYKLWLRLSSPLPVWFLFVCTFWLWHDVQIDRLVLQADWVHRFENVTLMGTAVCYWWHILAASPRLHPALPPLWRVGYAALGATPVKLVGLVLMFTSTAVYQYPAEIQLYNLNLTDQSLGAALVWVVGGIVFTWTAVLLMRDWLKGEDEKPQLPESVWSSAEMMLAPGFSKSPTSK